MNLNVNQYDNFTFNARLVDNFAMAQAFLAIKYDSESWEFDEFDNGIQN